MAHVHEIETAVGKDDPFLLCAGLLQERSELLLGHDLRGHGPIIPAGGLDGKRQIEDVAKALQRRSHVAQGLNGEDKLLGGRRRWRGFSIRQDLF